MTSIEWLVEQFSKHYAIHQLENEIQQAKQMHKQEIIDAWNGGDYAYFYSKETGKDFENGEQYYQEMFELEQQLDIPSHIRWHNRELPKQETLYTEEQVREAYFKGATDVHDKCTDRTWRGVETKVDIELLKKLNDEYIQSLKQPKKD